MLSNIIVDSLVFDFEFIVIANGKNQVVIEQIKHSSLFIAPPHNGFIPAGKVGAPAGV
jgi:hypothetical protein